MWDYRIIVDLNSTLIDILNDIDNTFTEWTEKAEYSNNNTNVPWMHCLELLILICEYEQMQVPELFED